MRKTIFAVILLVPALAAAAHVKKPEANVDKRKAPANANAPIKLGEDAPNFCLFGGQSGKAMPGEAAFNSIVWRSDVVYVGETHDQPQDHRAQLAALKAMRIARGQKIAVGFEMLDVTMQPVLDDYAAGKLTEEEFLAKTDWKNNWGFDFAMYKPLFDFVRDNKLRALALNVPRAVAAKVARAGLEGLSADERALLPEKVEVSRHQKYNDYLKETFGGHGGSPMGDKFTFANYQASMAAWNEAMGARIAAFMEANPGFETLVIAGNGHLMYNAAIPASVKARAKGLRQASFYTQDAQSCPEAMPKEHKDMANYLWYIKHPKPAPAAQPAAPPERK